MVFALTTRSQVRPHLVDTDRSRSIPAPPRRSRTVVHVTQSTETGVPHVVDGYVRSQRTAGWRVVVVCPGGTMAAMARASGAEVVTWSATRDPDPLGLLRELVDLRAILRAVDPDVVHLHSAKAGLVGRMLIRGRIPTLYMPHAWSWLAATGTQRRLARGWERTACRWSDVICCCSEDERREGTRAGVVGNLVVVPNDVDVEEIRRSAPATRESARAALGVAAEDRLVVCCARLAPQKGQELLLRAWPRILSAVGQARLSLVGGGPDEARLTAIAGAMPGIDLVGRATRAESLAWIVASDVVVCPSRYEGSSLVPIEAAVLGRAVVATDVQGMREGGAAAARRVVPVDDADALADAIAGLLSHPDTREDLEAAALTCAAGMRGRARSTTQLLGIYDQLLHHA